ncbi:MAG: T9SS type A sorting domain-containing protein [Candidatus Kapabacteria bacterium]|nr:T9SS type A sorting domain-containing protein [Candidatus Kapabacteria bacterium]
MKTQKTSSDTIKLLFNRAARSTVMVKANDVADIVEHNAHPRVRLVQEQERKTMTLFFTSLLSVLLSMATVVLLWGVLPKDGAGDSQKSTVDSPQYVPSDEHIQLNETGHSSKEHLKRIVLQTISARPESPVRRSANVNIEGVAVIELSREELHVLNLDIKEECALRSYVKRADGVIEVRIHSPFAKSIDVRESEQDMGWVLADRIPQTVMLTTSRGRVITYTPDDNDPSLSAAYWKDNTMYPTPESKFYNDKPYNEVHQILIQPGDEEPTVEQMNRRIEENIRNGVALIFIKVTKEQDKQMHDHHVGYLRSLSGKIRGGRLVAVGAAVSSTCSERVLAWYELDSALIAHLPQRYRRALSNEAGIEYTEDETAAHDDSRVQSGCRYLDACRTFAGVISSSSIYPNPATTLASLDVHIRQSRVCTVTLHYLNGIHAATLHQQLRLDAGKQSIPIKVSDIPDGIYIISLITDAGERILQKVVVGR